MSTEVITTSGLDRLLSIDDLAGYLGVPVATIFDWRVSGKGPCSITVGRHLKLAVNDVQIGSSGTANRRRGTSLIPNQTVTALP